MGFKFGRWWRRSPDSAHMPNLATLPDSSSPTDEGGRAPEAEQKQVVDYLLAEMTTARELIGQDIAMSNKRIDVLLVIVSAFGAAIALLSQTHIAPENLAFIAAIGSSALMLVSFSIYFDLLETEVKGDHHWLVLTMIRNYFARQYPSASECTRIATFLRNTLPQLPFTASGNVRIAIAIAAVSTGAAISSTWLFVTRAVQLEQIALAAGGGACLVVILVLRWHSEQVVKQRKQRVARISDQIARSPETPASGMPLN
jgi:hypothetical protein